MPVIAAHGQSLNLMASSVRTLVTAFLLSCLAISIALINL
jgi:hypothetical protein